MSLTRWMAALVGVGSLLATALPAVSAPAHAQAADGVREGSSHVPDSTYGDPCEARTPIDLRSLTVEDLFEHDRARVVEGTVRVEAAFCAPVPDATARAIRVDLYPRLDGPDGPDYSETASRTLVMGYDGTRWTWQLRSGTSTVSSGTAAPVGDAGRRTGIVADVPACDLAAASGARCDANRNLPTSPVGPLPPLSIRACTQDVDCGPSYRTVNGTTGDDPAPELATVDYLPGPRYYQLTYPSICQVGGVARTQQRTSPTEIIATAHAAPTLVEAGFTRLADLPDGRVRLHGSLAAAERLVGDAQVEPVLLRRAEATPNDPYYAPGGPGGETGQWSLRRIGFETSYGIARGEGTRVAIIDSGYDGRHPDVGGRAVAVRDFVGTRDGGVGGDLDRNADSDLNGHGTFVASMVAAATDNGAGMAALASGSRLLVARVFDAEGCASDGAVVDAMAWAVNAGADALNLSLGGSGTSPALEVAGIDASFSGAVPVAAAGNSGTSRLEYPAAYSSYISVAATGYAEGSTEDPVASYSTRNNEVDIAAPGGTNSGLAATRDILGACWLGPLEGHGFCRESGTSFAAPLVAASVAVARSIDPDRTAPGVVQLLTDTALDIRSAPGTTTGWDDRTGAGRLDIGKATSLLSARKDTLDDLPDSATATTASIAASKATFPAGSARHVVLARDDVFADALAGAPLAGDEGPILLTPRDRLSPRIRTELQRVLSRGGRVWMLGGEAALSSQVVADVRAAGYAPARLHGRTRVETAVAVARQVGLGPTGEVLVASAANWPDAISGGVYAAEVGAPLLLTWPDTASPERSPGVLQTVRDLRATEAVVLGGDAAVSGKVFAQLQQLTKTKRVAGTSRFSTATEVARVLWGRGAYAPNQGFVTVNGDRADGWAMGLVAAPVAARADAPLLMINDGLTTDEPSRYLRNTLRYRLDRPAEALHVGPFTATAEPVTRAYTPQRLRELLGG